MIFISVGLFVVSMLVYLYYSFKKTRANSKKDKERKSEVITAFFVMLFTPIFTVVGISDSEELAFFLRDWQLVGIGVLEFIMFIGVVVFVHSRK